MTKQLLRTALVVLSATLALYACKQQPVAPPPPTFELTGHVEHAYDGVTAIPGVLIVVSQENNEVGRDTTDDIGHFDITNLPQGGKLLVTASKPGCQTAIVALETDSIKTQREICIHLRDSSKEHANDSCCGVARIVVIDDSSRARVAFAYVELHGEGSSNGRVGKTDSAGVVEFTGLCKGYYSVTVGKDGYAQGYAKFEIDSCATVTTEVHLKKGQGHQDCCGRIEVSICDNTNNSAPLGGAKVYASGGNGGQLSGITDQNGKIAFEKVCNGEYTVTVAKEGYGSKSAQVNLKGDSCPVAYVKLCLDKKTTSDCCGKLILMVGDSSRQCSAIAGAKVYVSGGNQNQFSGTTDDKGMFTLEHLCKGEYTVTATKDGFGYASTKFSVGDSCPTVTRKLCLAKKTTDTSHCCNTLNVTVRDKATGDVISGATVRLAQNSANGLTQTTNPNGFCSFTKLCNGEYSVTASKDGYNYVTTSVKFSSDSCTTQSIEITLEKKQQQCCSGSYSLTVTEGDSSSTLTPVVGAYVTLSINGQIYKGTKTDSTGKAFFDGLCAGTSYYVNVSKDGYTPYQTKFMIDSQCSPIKQTAHLSKK